MGCARISCGWSKRLKLNETSGVSFRLRVVPRLEPDLIQRKDTLAPARYHYTFNHGGCGDDSPR
jgi:hypothetical protein